MIIHHLDRRQQWGWPMNGMTTSIGEWAIHNRFLGVNPTLPSDLIASMLLCIAFLASIGGCVFIGRNQLCRTIGLYTLLAASVLFFLAFAIRAGISNSTNPTKSSFIAECLFLVFGQLCVFDAWMMRMADELIDFQDHKCKTDLRGPETWKGKLEVICKNWPSRIIFVTRVVIAPLCVILYIVGYVTIPDPSVGTQIGSKTATRGVASFLVIAALCSMQIVTLNAACFEQPPWVPFSILFGISILIWLPTAYAFSLIATALDTSSFVRAKTFFYIGFGLAHFLAIAGLLVMHRQKPIWNYEGEPGPEEKAAAEPSIHHSNVDEEIE